ncbi:MAG TPA: hypothetical protein VI837_05240 [Blastocatellia bacterium]|nr:hypothetical protein [Blastocatellia bacterium]
MTTSKRLLTRLSITVVVLTLAPAASFAGDESFSSVVKHIKSSYHAKQQGFFGAMMLARFAVKVIKPAGVKNFKVVLLRDLDYSEAPSPRNGQFHAFIQSKIDPRWTPLVQYSSLREKQWTYVYITREKEDVKLLVVTLQQKDAVVLQTKFSPAKLVEFMNNPQIMGISLNSDNRSKDRAYRADDPDDEDDNDPPKRTPPVVKPPQ